MLPLLCSPPQLVRFYYKADVKQKAKILRKVLASAPFLLWG